MNPDLLSQLRDIHSAAAAPWWPPAPGWWVLALILMALLVWLGRSVLARFRIHQRRQQMLAWIDHLNVNTDPVREPQAYLSTLNRIFKLVALRAFPGQQCALLAGQNWSDFLKANINDANKSEPLDVLATGPYDPAPKFDTQVMSDLTRDWIKQHG